MSAFVPPSWFTGLLVWIGYLIIPVIIGVVAWLFFAAKDKPGIAFTILIICLIVGIGGSQVLWWQNYEVPSVHSEEVTVQDWQPKAGLKVNEKGLMVIDSADDLMLITTDGKGYLNNEHFLFGKFDTRDILNKAKPGAKLNITSYGWREGFNDGFPNILSVEVIDDSHAQNKTVADYFGTKVV